jgi:hypothetical protein
MQWTLSELWAPVAVSGLWNPGFEEPGTSDRNERRVRRAPVLAGAPVLDRAGGDTICVARPSA